MSYSQCAVFISKIRLHNRSVWYQLHFFDYLSLIWCCFFIKDFGRYESVPKWQTVTALTSQTWSDCREREALSHTLKSCVIFPKHCDSAVSGIFFLPDWETSIFGPSLWFSAMITVRSKFRLLDNSQCQPVIKRIHQANGSNCVR